MGPVRLRLLLAHHPPDRGARGGAGARATAAPPMVRAEISRLAPAGSLRAAAAACRSRSPRRGAATARRPGSCSMAIRFPSRSPAIPPHRRCCSSAATWTALDARRVAVVGTRNATNAGLDTAHELGADLAAAGVSVVSGLARGIDGAAHRGVRAATPRAAGRGRRLRPRSPVPSPARRAVALGRRAGAPAVGVGARHASPTAWRFPLRNRIIAALAEVLVVVESRERGGSLITARLARRSIARASR
jgi:hypothetical protein